jgi:hypothetical protein
VHPRALPKHAAKGRPRRSTPLGGVLSLFGFAPFRELICSVSCLVVAGVIQLVECQLPKLDVAGSSPVARSRNSSAIIVVTRVDV